MTDPHALELPATHAAADTLAGKAQQRYLLLMRGSVVLPLLAVAFALAGREVTSFAVLSAVAVGLLALARIVQRSSHAEPAWYEARATAEAIKSLAWRYAVRASPFDRNDEDEQATDERFLTHLRRETEDDAEPLLLDRSGEITESMRALRAAPFPVRRDAYVAGRIVEQTEWHGRKARRAAVMAGRLDVLHYSFDAVAVGASIFLLRNPKSDLSTAVIAVAASGAGAVLAWAGVRRYSNVSRQYAGVALELDLLNEQVRHVDTKDEWCRLVDGVEAALAAEHALWRASRGQAARFRVERREAE